VKLRMFILTTGAVFALVAPAAHAGNSNNRLYQTHIHTILAEKKVAKSTKSAWVDSRQYQTQVHTVLADNGVGVVADKSAAPQPQSSDSSRR